MADVSNCVKSKVQTINNNLAALESAVSHALCVEMRTLLAGAEGVLQAELTLIVPVVDLSAIFAQNFVLFPLNAAISTIGTVSSVTNTLFSAGLGNDCPDQKQANDSMANQSDRLQTLKKDLVSAATKVQAFIDDVHALEGQIQNGINSINFISNNLKCQ